MADGLDNLTERVQVVEQKLEHLTTTVTELSASVDRGFKAVDEAFLEQRQYTEFCFMRLEAKMDAGFERVDARFRQIDARFEQIDERFEQIDARFEQIDARFEQIDARFEQIDARFKQIDARFSRMDGRLARIERKLDQFIDVQSKTNELVERRLRGLES